MASAVYALCALTSALCAGLLIRGFHSSRSRLLLWSSICFVGLAINNALLVTDLVLIPRIDLSLWRGLLSLLALLALVYGLIWDTK